MASRRIDRWLDEELRAASRLPWPARRNALRALTAMLAIAALPGCGSVAVEQVPARPFRPTRDPFALGVASGAPRADGVVLWTRLAYEPGVDDRIPDHPIEVSWEIASDEAFRDPVRDGTVVAGSGLAHSIHVEIDGLSPDRWYWYRFRAGGAESPAGRTRTMPRPHDEVAGLRLALASCQQYEQGYYTAYRHMREEDLDLVVFVGDYIYESSWGSRHVRKHLGGEPRTLDEYRLRHAQYRSDPHLSRMHATAPWLVTWDDHEVDNDYAADRGQDLDPAFLSRRAAAYRAYYEHMPLPRRSLSPDGSMRIYDRYRFGRLAEFHVLDGRQYRSHQACPRTGRGGSNVVPVADCRALREAGRTMLGAQQERWLLDGLAASGTQWRLIAQQTLMARAQRVGDAGPSVWTDAWDGYPQARARLLDHLAEHRVDNVVVLGGDVHSYWVTDLKRDFDDPASPVVATEFVGTSITSQGWSQSRIDAVLRHNPHIRYARGDRRGYTVLEVRPDRVTATLRAVDTVKEEAAGVDTLARFAVESGRAGAMRA